ncbi:MAG TPA: peptide-methionine (S)-S-oxide reductase MsrA [Saprospiraceae bacterium]|nr:peptide-methionine (S)-S-oxide reductase MsrA [Saprospiraceae bacterium]
MNRILSLLFSCITIALFGSQNPNIQNQNNMSTEPINDPGTKEVITLGGGCFWCIEAVFQDLNGVEKVVSGYTGGDVKNPNYREVCGGSTGHAEAVQITFDPSIITLEEILEVFWTTHDPTTLNRQGADRGTQYRSAIFYSNEEQLAKIDYSMKEVAPKIWDDPIVTDVAKLTVFYPAETYHQNYYKQNENQSYCQVVINPKLRKVREKFAAKMKK